jgi:XTP/dITP diphosphohydrolase
LQLLIATRNAGKRREFEALLDGLDLRLVDLSGYEDAPEVAEEAPTYVDNARSKAVVAARFTGLPALADDSGLEVDFLDGKPGVRSARFAADLLRGSEPGGGGARDARNVDLLLEKLAAAPPERRSARFRCVIVVARPDGRELVSEGTCEGEITTEIRGGNGFGYDPVFLYRPMNLTFAEMPPAEKQRISHRANAILGLKERLAPFLG